MIIQCSFIFIYLDNHHHQVLNSQSLATIYHYVTKTLVYKSQSVMYFVIRQHSTLFMLTAIHTEDSLQQGQR